MLLLREKKQCACHCAANMEVERCNKGDAGGFLNLFIVTVVSKQVPPGPPGYT